MNVKKFFPNGYGASIISHDFSYGGKAGLLEIAVLKGNKENYELCYDTPITDDVIGYLTHPEAEEICNKIEALPNLED